MKVKYAAQMIFGMLALTTLLATAPAQAGWFSKHKSSQQTSVPTAANAPEDAQLLNGLIQKVSQGLSQLQVLMSQGQYQSALTMAKASLDEARVKTGIDPKSQRREIISVQDGTFASDYNTLGMSLSDFPINTQNNIMSSVEAYRGGYFLDLLNLLKRTNLIYIEAFYQTLKQSPQGLMKEDIQKIRNDINAVRAVPLYLQDAKVGSLLLIFDYEVANSDQNYLFNRELKAYLMSEGKNLGYSSSSLEQTIDDELKTKVQSVRENFIRTESATQVSQKKQDNNPFVNENYQACMSWYWTTYDFDRVSSTNYCLGKYTVVNYKNTAFEGCMSYTWTTYDDTRKRSVQSCEKFGTF